VTGSQTERIQAQFGGSAAAYVASPGHAGGEDLDTLVAWGRALGPRRVLDVATGAGHTAIAFASFAGQVTALDLTEPMLRAARDFARRRGAERVTFVAGDVERIPFRSQSFDVVTCRIAPHHFADVPAAVREVARLLQPGGVFLLQDIRGHDDPDCAAFILEVERRRDPTHVRAYRAIEWRGFLEAAGLEVLDETVLSKTRPWEEWTTRTRMTPEARQDLDRFVRAAPERCRAAFDFTLHGDRIESFDDRMLLIRARKR
jgi:ubiquinone/menaquinone biosynthesis C-methylase UbiE